MNTSVWLLYFPRLVLFVILFLMTLNDMKREVEFRKIIQEQQKQLRTLGIIPHQKDGK